MFIPVNTSNSVFAVPAPTDGTLKYPVEYSLNNDLRNGIGSLVSWYNSTSVGSKKDSSCTKITVGISLFVGRVSFFVKVPSLLISSIVSSLYTFGKSIPVLNTLAEKQYGSP